MSIVNKKNIIDDLNSTTTTILADEVFTGTWSYVLDYNGISVLLDGTSNGVSNGTLQMQFSHDGVTVHRDIVITIDDITSANPRTLAVIAPYFRIIYTNSSVDMTSTNFQTIHHTQQVELTSRLNQTLTGNEDVKNVRSIITGSDNNGTYRNIECDLEGSLNVNLTSNQSAFGDLRCVEMTPILQATFPYVINSDLWTTISDSSGTIGISNSMVVLNSNTDVSGSAEIVSRQAIHYRAGMGMLCRFTALYSQGIENSYNYAGLGELETDVDGLFIGYYETDFAIIYRNNNVESIITQANFNKDKLDGTGPSGMTINPQNINVFQIQIQYLGAGTIKFFCENPLTGKFFVFHQINYANNFTVPSLNNPTLPFHAHAKNFGNNTNVFVQICSVGLFIEGQNVLSNVINTASNTVASAGTTETHIFSIRNVSNFNELTGGSNIVNKIRVYLRQISFANDNTRLAKINAYIGSQLTTPVWTDVNGLNSVVQKDIAGTIAGYGKLVQSFVIAKDSGSVIDLSSLSLFFKPGETLTFTVTLNGAGTSDVFASLLFVEDF